jgi:hypothetical protein
MSRSIHAPIPVRRVLFALGVLASWSCSGQTGSPAVGGAGPKPSDFLTNASVQAALKDLASHNTVRPGVTPTEAYCASFAAWLTDPAIPPYFDGATAGSEAPPIDITGSWTWVGCNSIDADSYPTTSPCSGSITWSNEIGGQITQAECRGEHRGLGHRGDHRLGGCGRRHRPDEQRLRGWLLPEGRQSAVCDPDTGRRSSDVRWRAFRRHDRRRARVVDLPVAGVEVRLHVYGVAAISRDAQDLVEVVEDLAQE